MFKLGKKNVDDEIPTASMADIAFLLIVYFMVTTTFTATRGLDFALPKEDDAPPVVEKEESVLIEIRADGGLVVDQKPMRLEDVVSYLKPKLERNPLKPVIIQPDPQSAYHHMVRVFDTLRQGKEELGLKKDINISIPTRREIEQFWY
jgi:biopolymer transport protein ExbD